MLKWNYDMTSVPKSRNILMLINDCAIECTIVIPKDGEPYHNPIFLDSHGCGCCGYSDPPPEAWCELPKKRAGKS